MRLQDRLIIRLSQEDKEKVKQKAKDKQVSISDLIRLLINQL
jgi:predicted DNA binding CopG/RHH family protein